MPIEKLHDRVVLRHPKGSSAEILFYGATVISWKSAGPKNHELEPIERLFVSSKAALDGSKPVRGGIPLVFPCFGAPTHPQHLKLNQHGFARSEVWIWDDVVLDNEAGVSVRLTLEPTERVRNVYDRPFHLSYVVTLAEHQITTNIHVTNTSHSEALEYQALFHNYIRAPANEVSITTLQNLSYYDKTEPTAEGKATPKIESRVMVDVKNFTDSVYEDAHQCYQVLWPANGIEVRSHNLKDVVIWNPQNEGHKINDMEKDGWERYVCVEPGFVRGFVKLAPEKMWIGHQPSMSLSVQINQIDYTLVPSGPLDNSSLPRVPVIRIFGSSSTGKQACLHVHQVYPYFFIEYQGKLTANHVKHYISKLTGSLNHAIALSLKRDPTSSDCQFIRAILLVKGIHFYGFHTSYSPFLKIMMVDPGYAHRTVTILQSGIVMGTRFFVFESHLSFVLQFMCDFGLYGCGWIDVEQALQRDIQSNLEGDYSSNSDEQTFNISPYTRQTRMPLEVDVVAPNILNRQNITARNLHHKLQIPAPPLPPEPLVLSVRELWEDERKRRVARGLEPSPTLPMDPTDSRRGAGNDWVAEAEYWDQLRTKLEADRKVPEFEQSQTNGWDNWAMTTFESIEALWEKQWRVWKPEIKNCQETSRTTVNGEGSAPLATWDAADDINCDTDIEAIDVDVSKLSSQEISRFLDAQEFEWAQPDEEETADMGADLEDHETLEEDYSEDVQENVSSASALTDPFVVVVDGSTNDPQKMEFKLSSPPERPYRELNGSPITPTRQLHPSQSRGIRDRSTQQDGATFAPEDEGNVPPDNYLSSPSPMPDGFEIGDKLPMVKLYKENYTVQTMKKINLNRYEYFMIPPPATTLVHDLSEYGLPDRIYRPPHYSSTQDIPNRPREYAGLLYHIKGGHGVTHLESWDGDGGTNETLQLSSDGIGGWEYSSSPPGVKDTRRWLTEEDGRAGDRAFPKMRSQIEGTTQTNVYGFKETPGQQQSAFRGRQAMSVLALEVFGGMKLKLQTIAPTNEGKTPNADNDPITVLSYAYQISGENLSHDGMVVVRSFSEHRLYKEKLEVVESEIDLINSFVDIVETYNPDIVVGWDIQKGSWGYLNNRAQIHGLFNNPLVLLMAKQLTRVRF
ncbi:hypothetical protein H0H92_007193 [Tricholoma furcatifolium]|nr:hypothetical protein H0H92_007193 [Tricholoma furcatifolium]